MRCEFIPLLADVTQCKTCGKSFYVHDVAEAKKRKKIIVAGGERKRHPNQTPPDVEAAFISRYRGQERVRHICAEMCIHMKTAQQILRRNGITKRGRRGWANIQAAAAQ